MAPRQAEMLCNTSEHSASWSSVLSIASTWPLIRRTRLSSFFFSSVVWAVRSFAVSS